MYFQPDGTVVVGQTAVNAAQGFPDRVVRWVKRHMGNPSWHTNINGRDYSPVDISAMILKKVKQDAESILGPLKSAVVTVPAYFDEVRRKATMDAAAQAGLEVLRIINEPTAAALAYATGIQMKGRILIYDFGGGTFDVSIVEIESAEDVRVIASEGDHQLGGFDLDKVLAMHFNEVFHTSHGVQLFASFDDPAAHDPLVKAESTKRQLSRLPAHSVPLNWGGHSMLASVARSAFETLIRDHIVRTEMLIENALDAAGIAASAIDEVVLVGGSTRIPAVQEMLRRKFNRAPVCRVNPDEAVALGAALQAGMLMVERGLIDLPTDAKQSLERTRLRDVAPHSYGTIYVGDAHGRLGLRNEILIPKNTPLPCSKTKPFYTVVADQQSVQCRITQGEDEDPEFANTIAEGVLELPPGRPAECEVRVTYSYDANGRMSCEFLDVESGHVKRFDLDIAAKIRPSVAVPSLDQVCFEDLVIE